MSDIAVLRQKLAKFEANINNPDLSEAQKAPFIGALPKLKAEIASLEEAEKPQPAPKPIATPSVPEAIVIPPAPPMPPALPVPVKAEKTDAEKAAFAAKMQAAKAAKAAERAASEPKAEPKKVEPKAKPKIDKPKKAEPKPKSEPKKEQPKPMAAPTPKDKFRKGDRAMWYDTPVVVLEVLKDGAEYEIHDGHRIHEVKLGDLDPMNGELEYIGEVRIGCDMKAYRNTSGKKMHVGNINGDLLVEPNDVILYLPENGHSFTNIKEEMVYKRCIVVKEAEIEQPTPVTAAKIEKMIEDTAEPVVTEAEPKKVEPKEKPKKQPKPAVELPDDVNAAIEKQTEKMIVDGCNVAHFVKQTKGTPIRAYLLGEVERFNNGDNKFKITRIGIDKQGRYIAEMVEQGSFMKFSHDVYYFKVCPESGSETLLDYNEALEAKRAFEKGSMKIQFSKDAVKRIYNRGESFEVCNELAKAAYIDHEEGALAKFRQRCLNPQLIDYYKEKNAWVHKKAATWRKRVEKFKGMSHYEVANIIRQKMKSDYRVHNRRVKN